MRLDVGVTLSLFISVATSRCNVASYDFCRVQAVTELGGGLYPPTYEQRYRVSDSLEKP